MLMRGTEVNIEKIELLNRFQSIEAHRIDCRLVKRVSCSDSVE